MYKGIYSFKLYNRGVACGSNSVYFDKGTRTLNPNFMLPSVLYASDGKYKFNFEKSTGSISLLLFSLNYIYNINNYISCKILDCNNILLVILYS